MSRLLPVMEHFYTLQGEGAFAGQAAYFIRLGGCDVGCVWCDVKESWNADNHPKIDVWELADAAASFPSRLVVITGGEPAMYDLSELCKALKSHNFRIHIETSGVYPLTGQIDWITFSPKKFKTPLNEVAQNAHELKVIVFNKSDFEWAMKYQNLVNKDCLLWIQPEWDKRELVTEDMIHFIQSNPAWRMSVQTHKYLNIP